MNDGLVKTPEESALDDVTARATELLELSQSLEDSEHFAALCTRCRPLLERLDGHVQQLFAVRRARGQLPAIGNVERAQVGAAAARLESLLPGASDAAVAAEKLHAAGAALQAAIESGAPEVADETTAAALTALGKDVTALLDLLAQ